MQTLTINVPSAIRKFLDSVVSKENYRNASDYLRELIESDRKRRERKELERLLLEGLDSGPAEPWTDADWKEMHEELRRGAAKRRKRRAS